MHPPHRSSLRYRALALVTNLRFQALVLAVILVNAATIGMQVSPWCQGACPLLRLLDVLCLVFFVCELSLKAFALGRRFLRDPWNWFDVVVVGVACLPAAGPLSVIRSLRVLRTLRMITVVPSIRRVVHALLASIPSMTTIIAVQGLVLYVYAVLGVEFFGRADPGNFGGLEVSFFTLFQILTLDNWTDIARPLMASHVSAWIFFPSFILLGTFTVLNLFIAVLSTAMQHITEAEAQDVSFQRQVLAELKELRAELRRLTEKPPT